MPPPKVTTRSLFTCLTHHESAISPPSSGPLRTIVTFIAKTLAPVRPAPTDRTVPCHAVPCRAVPCRAVPCRA
eukprot:1213923-Prymnesium_polylepis.1